MSWPTIGAEGTITSWGSTNFYSTFLAAITPNAGTMTISNDAQDVTGINAYAATTIPGLKSATATIAGFLNNAGSAGAPYIGNAFTLTFSGGYVVNPISWEWTASSPDHDITSRTIGGGTPLWKYFRPDIFSARLRYTCFVDSSTTIALPLDPNAATSSCSLAYGNSATLAANGIITNVPISIVRGQRNLVTYELMGTGSWVSANGPFGTSRTFGNTANTDPLWTAGVPTSSPAGALVLNTGNSKTLTAQDSFWTQLRLAGTVSGAVQASANIRVTGTVVAA